VLNELLPAVRGLRALADEGPRALADSRVSLIAGRRSRIVQSPVGVIGLRGPSASPWAEPALEAGAALLAGNAVILPAGAQRLRAVFLRAGVPGELLAHEGELEATRIVDLPRPTRHGTLLVLPGAPRAKVVEAALWAAFAGHASAAGRLVTVAGAVPGLVDALVEGAAALSATDLGPRGRPTVIAGVSAEDDVFRAPPPGPVLAVVEAPDTETAIALAPADAPVSIWARDPAQGERIARRLGAQITWIGRHGAAETAVPVRIARHVVARQLESRAAWARGTPRLPVERRFVAAEAAVAELRHGRESRRWPALRALVRARRER
jgi:hypothetical protein